jgi:hypothetical protein
MLASELRRRLRAHAAWAVYIAVALACTWYFNARSDLVPKWGIWYSDGDPSQPYVLLQVRAFLAGRTALFTHPIGAGHDYNWGRGGMHQAWGLGIPLIATPFHLLGRLFGAPGFPDDARFLILYAMTTVALVRALHRASPKEPSALFASAAAGGAVMVFPTFVGLVTARFLVYEQTIAVGDLWDVALLAGVIALFERCTVGRLAFVCAAAGFSTAIRPPIGIYGFSTVMVGLFVARRAGVSLRGLLGGFAAYVAGTGVYLVGNILRFGDPLNAGYANSLSGPQVNRLTRWGLPFAKVPMTTAMKEMFMTFFIMKPVTSQQGPTAELQPYITGERWREYYAPTYDRVILAAWFAALGIVLWRVVSRRLWRRDRPLNDDLLTFVGAWGLLPSLVLFVFYSHVGNMVTRYASDLYPGFAATSLCAGMAVVDAIRKRAPAWTSSAQIAIAGFIALYLAAWPPWAQHMSQPVDRKAIVASIAALDARAAHQPPVPDRFKCNEPRGPSPMHTHLEDWHSDCTFSSGMVFAMPRARCIEFTLNPNGPTWTAADELALQAFRANADSDQMVPCGPASVEGQTRKLTVCEPRPPHFLVDGMRLYSLGVLDDKLVPIDRLKLTRIDPAPVCR